MKKKLIYGVLGVLLLSNTTSVLATSLGTETSTSIYSQTQYENMKLIEDTENVRIVENRDGDTIFTSTYDKVNNTVSIEERNLTSKTITNSTLINLNENKVNIPSDYQLEQESKSWSYYEKTFTNYEYFKYSNINGFQIARPKGGFHLVSKDYKNAYYSGNNKSKLDSFKNYVDSINSLEGKVIANATMSGASAVFSFLLNAASLPTGGSTSPAAMAAALAAMGLGAKTIDYAIDLFAAMKKANQYYIEIVNNF